MILISRVTCVNTHTWKTPACHEEIKAFQQRAFSILGGNDRIVWKFNMLGEFSASSTYRVLVNENQHDMAQSWSPTLWKRLWRLKLPFKMIIFFFGKFAMIVLWFEQYFT